MCYCAGLECLAFALRRLGVHFECCFNFVSFAMVIGLSPVQQRTQRAFMWDEGCQFLGKFMALVFELRSFTSVQTSKGAPSFFRRKLKSFRIY